MVVATAWCQSIDASIVLRKSIQYHDPQGKMNRFLLKMNLKQFRPDGSNRESTIIVGLNSPIFSLEDNRNDDIISMNNFNGDIRFKVNGNESLDNQTLEKYRLSDDRFQLMHNYYRYLWFAPLVLKDPGTHISVKSTLTEFNNQKVWTIKVTYDPDVGSDIWYFYFDEESYKMVGYCFYKDVEETRGEYIHLTGELEKSGLRIPASRKWYMFKDDEYLGTDELVDVALIKDHKKQWIK